MKLRTVVMATSLLTLPVAARAAEDLPGPGKRLKLMHIQVSGETRAALKKAVARFEAATGAAVNAEAVKNDMFKQKLDVTLGSSDPPDVFHTWGGGRLAAYVKENLVQPLPGDLPTEGISPRALNLCRVGGALYAVPVDFSIVTFWYRKSVLEKHGVQMPKTADELIEACVKLCEAGVTPIALGNKGHWPGAFYFDYVLVRYGGGPEYIKKSVKAGQPARTEATEAARAFIARLARVDAFSEGFNQLDYDDSRATFFSGEAAMTLMGSWLLSYARSDAKADTLMPDLDIGPFPAMGQGHDAEVLGGTNAAYAVAARSRHKALAIKLVEYLTDAEAAKDWAAAGRMTARRVQRPEGERLLDKAYALLESAPRVQQYFDQALGPALSEKHKPHTQRAFAVDPPRRWVRFVVGGVAVLALLIVVAALRSAFRSGEGTAG